MPSLCFYFQVHQPFRIRRFSYFDVNKDLDYFDEKLNAEILRKVAHKCYLPTNRLMLELIQRYRGAFRIAYSITGVAIEQFERYSPETLDSFKALADTGCVEFLGETYYHSLASVYDTAEFQEQVEMHSALMAKHFGTRPCVFRNTELIYDDGIAQLIARMGYKATIAEGADDILSWRSPNYVYTSQGTRLPLLLKNYRLADDVAFRFSNQEWDRFPLTADTYAGWIHAISGAGDLVNLFMDYETFGEHQWDSTGIFNFMEHLPGKVLERSDWDFCTPSEAVDRYPSRGELSFPRLTSWADVDRDLTAWRGNSMQEKALGQIHALEAEVRATGDAKVMHVWRQLQTSDHFYYMCTKWFADGDVHTYFSPFESPYDAFLNYENILKDFRLSIASRTKIPTAEAPRSGADQLRVLAKRA